MSEYGRYEIFKERNRNPRTPTKEGIKKHKCMTDIETIKLAIKLGCTVEEIEGDL